LLTLPTVDVIEADVHDSATLAELARGTGAVINLVGVLHSAPAGPAEPYGADFARNHVSLPEKIVHAAHQVGVPRLIHMSALKAATDGPSEYLRSKAAGEARIRGFKGHWTLLQPSVIFGPDDHFLNLFARLIRRFPVLPLGCPSARFQPVFVEDVAEWVARCLDEPASFGQTYELCGPRVYTLRRLVEYVGELTGHPARVLPLPPALAYLQAWVFEHLPGRLLSRDNLASMSVDNVCFGPPQPCLGAVSHEPTALESVAPSYLAHRLPRDRFAAFRRHARR
jgi:NADH dehydrogenase